MPNTVIYHNPRCSKSRQTLELLQDNNIKPMVIEYLKTPPSIHEIEKILELLRLEPRDIIRDNEAEYKDQQLADETLSNDQLIQAIHDYPKILQRPIVIHGNKAAIGRPPESVLNII